MDGRSLRLWKNEASNDSCRLRYVRMAWLSSMALISASVQPTRSAWRACPTVGSIALSVPNRVPVCMLWSPVVADVARRALWPDSVGPGTVVEGKRWLRVLCSKVDFASLLQGAQRRVALGFEGLRLLFGLL